MPVGPLTSGSKLGLSPWRASSVWKIGRKESPGTIDLDSTWLMVKGPPRGLDEAGDMFK